MSNPDNERARIIDNGFETAKRWGIRIIVIAIVAWLIGWLIEQFWVALFPLAIALMLSTLLAPIAAWLRAKRIPSPLASLSALVFGLAIVATVISALIPQVIEQAPEIAKSAVDGLATIEDWLLEGPLGVSAEQINAAITSMQDQVMRSATAIGTGALATISAVTSFLINIILIIMLTFFLINDGHRFIPWLKDLLGSHAGQHAGEVLNRSWTTLGAFIRTQGLVALIDSVIIGLGLAILGQPLWLPLAVIIFFGGFIPIIGALITGVLAVLVTLVTNGVNAAIIATVIVLVVQQLEGNILSPYLQGKYVKLPAAIVLLAVTIGGSQFGVAGAFLAVPVVASVAGAFRYMKEQLALKVAAQDKNYPGTS